MLQTEHKKAAFKALDHGFRDDEGKERSRDNSG
jgi:hypothetical protein